jgi:ceramide glucosyltransferase
LKGIDDELEENLASFCRQDYPAWQVVLGTADPADPALEVARRVRDRFPRLDLEIVAGAAEFGRNPKVTNLAAMGERARHAHWLIADSNVRVGPGYLRAMAAELARPGVGLVTSPFCGEGERRLGALFENLHLGTWIPAGMCAVQLLTGSACVVGKSMLFRRADLERAGGLEGVRDVLAEDYVIGRRIEALGMKTATSPLVVRTVNASWPLRRFAARHLRWGQIRRRLTPLGFLAEALLYPTPWALALALAGWPALGLSMVAVKVLSDGLVARHVSGRFPAPWKLALVPVKDLLIAALWPVALFKRTLSWRGNRLRIGPGTVLLPLDGEPRDPRGPGGPAGRGPLARSAVTASR